MRWFFSLLLLALLGTVQALSSAGNRLLVVLEETADKDKYSHLWEDLEARGYHTTFESPKSDKLSLFKLGERAYDHVLLLPQTSKAYGPSLSANLLLDFAKKEGNVLLALSANNLVPAAISSLLLELDIHLPQERNSLVVDHFNYDSASASEKHDVLVLPAPKALKSGAQNYFDVNGVIAVPRAVGQSLGHLSPLVAPILRAPATAYTYNTKDEAEAVEDPFAVGQQLSLISAVQARNSARFTVLGSAESLQNEWFSAKVNVNGKETTTANREFAKRLTGWTFKELGVIKAGRIHHYQNEAKTKPTFNATAAYIPENDQQIYRIKSGVSFTIELSEYSWDGYKPFEVPLSDAVQLEFSMLSPFHRLDLSPIAKTADSAIYGTTFTLPDQHGIFNFRVNYKRPFLTTVDIKQQVTVRHFAHDEWPRSWQISGAWVWISGIWVTVAGWIAFVALWLWSEPVRPKGGIKKKQ